MSNLLEQWNEHIIRGNQLSREIEDFDRIIGAGVETNSEIAFVAKGIGTTYISVLSPEKMEEFKRMILNAIYNARDEKTAELEKLMGLVPVIPTLPNGAVIGIVSQGKPLPHILPPDKPEVVIPDPVAKRKPATVNPEFEAAVQDMVKSKPQKLDKKQPEKNEPEPKPKQETKLSVMNYDDVKRMYQDEGKSMKEIADHYGIKKGDVNNFIYLNHLSRKKLKDDGFLDNEVQARRSSSK